MTGATSSQKLAAARRVAELVSLRAVDPRRLGEQDYRNAGAKYGIEAAALHAFADVESSGGGFSSDGRCIILYEPHIFSRETGGTWDGYQVAGVPCSYPKWVPMGAKLPKDCKVHPYALDQADRWGLLAMAAELDFEGALKACSWGSYQILGRNHALLGYPTAWQFVVALHVGAHTHLEMALSFLAANDVLHLMRKGDWRPVIKAWNGDGQVDKYLRVFLERLAVRRRIYA